MASDVLGAVYDFLKTFIKPEPEHIIDGWQNSAALPQDTASYIVLTLLDARRQGTNVHDWQALEGSDTDLQNGIKMLVLYDVQIDFCGTDEREVMSQAVQCATLARDAAAVDFFAGEGLSSLYAEDVRPMPFSNDLKQWEIRYSVTVHLSAWNAYTIEQEAFTRVKAKIENVDMHHKPKE